MARFTRCGAARSPCGFLAVLVLAACADNPYVIGRVRDAADGGGDPCAGALVCSGFEAPELRDEWSDVHLENAGAIERTTERAHRGEASLHAQSGGPASVADVVAQFEPVVAGTLYLRAYLYVPAGLPSRTMNLFFLGSRPDPSGGEPFVGVEINLLDGALQLFSPQAQPTRQTGVSRIPRARWFCLRAEIELSERAAATLFIDDTIALRASDVDSIAGGGVSMLRAGVDWSSEQAEFFEVFIDDIALSTAGLTCADG